MFIQMCQEFLGIGNNILNINLFAIKVNIQCNCAGIKITD